MTLPEAARLAHEKGEGIFRGHYVGDILYPTDTLVRCVGINYSENKVHAMAMWNPDYSDVVAKDWAVMKYPPALQTRLDSLPKELKAEFEVAFNEFLSTFFTFGNSKTRDIPTIEVVRPPSTVGEGVGST